MQVNSMKNRVLTTAIAIAGLLFCAIAGAKTYPLPQSGNVIGQVKTMTVPPGTNFPQIARDYDLGYVELLEANPGVDPDDPEPGTVLVIPTQYILPDVPRQGLVVNLAEMRAYFYPAGRQEVRTYPIGIGREGEGTITGSFTIIEKREKPIWRATEFMRKMRAAEGIILPESVPPGPENPLGDYALRLSKPTYLIHGTNEPLGGIGRRSSSGCLRLYPEDIEPLFHAVKVGTPVRIINEPYKAGILAGRLYLESHIPLQEDGRRIEDRTQIKRVIDTALKGNRVMIDWDKAYQISNEEQGIPQEVGQMMG
ncbi:MAG: erfK [Gammaproteobacteria bacterium]|jgi:L,D-transpeptidase ErfK/SrfK|nr:erfK [Gammaproteobacteria bacterium]